MTIYLGSSALAMMHGRIIDLTYLLTNELTSFLYNPTNMRVNARFASHSIELSVLAFSTVSNDLMPTTISFQSQGISEMYKQRFSRSCS